MTKVAEPPPEEKRINVDIGELRLPVRTICLERDIDLSTAAQEAFAIWIETWRTT